MARTGTSKRNKRSEAYEAEHVTDNGGWRARMKKRRGGVEHQQRKDGTKWRSEASIHHLDHGIGTGHAQQSDLDTVVM